MSDRTTRAKHDVEWYGVFRGTDDDPRECGWCSECGEVYDGDERGHRVSDPSERYGVRTLLRQSLELLRWPENGALHCRYCVHDGEHEHAPGCWWVQRTRRIEFLKERIRNALAKGLTDDV